MTSNCRQWRHTWARQIPSSSSRVLIFPDHWSFDRLQMNHTTSSWFHTGHVVQWQVFALSENICHHWFHAQHASDAFTSRLTWSVVICFTTGRPVFVSKCSDALDCRPTPNRDEKSNPTLVRRNLTSVSHTHPPCHRSIEVNWNHFYRRIPMRSKSRLEIVRALVAFGRKTVGSDSISVKFNFN